MIYADIGGIAPLPSRRGCFRPAADRGLRPSSSGLSGIRASYCETPGQDGTTGIGDTAKRSMPAMPMARMIVAQTAMTQATGTTA
jgi:hypothetical protein